MAWHSPFDLYYWFVNVFAGSLELFLAISFLVIAMIAGMFRFPTVITGVAFSLFIIMLSIQVTGTYFIVVFLLIAIVVGWSFARLFK